MNPVSIITKFDMFLVILFEPCLNRPSKIKASTKSLSRGAAAGLFYERYAQAELGLRP